MKVMIVGAGKLGTKLAIAMLNSDINITIVDTDPQVLDRLKDHLDVLTINANALRKDILEEVDIKSYDMVISVVCDDEINMLVCAMAKAMGCVKCVARIRNPEYSKQLDFLKKTFHIDHVINPDLATANEILRFLMGSYTFFFGDYADGKVKLFNFNVEKRSEFANKTLRQLSSIEGMLIVAIDREGEIIIPYGDTMIMENDLLHVIGKAHTVRATKIKYGLEKKHTHTRDVMIMGGSNIALHLAEELSRKNVGVKIVETNYERCKVLSDKLTDKVIILHGNGSDPRLLEEEGLEGMDAFVALTGFDEENLFMSLKAKQLGISKVVSKISHESYVSIVEKLGLDFLINPVNITASELLKIIRGGRVLSVSLMLDGKAEVTELIVKKSMPVVGIPFKELKLPKGIIVGAIVRKNDVLIPDGNTCLEVRDRIVLFSLLSETTTLEELFHLKDR